MRLRRVGDDHLVGVGRVLEEVVDAFLFHQPGGEVEIGLAVLHAVIARLERALELVSSRRALQHLLQDVGNGDVLKDPALRVARQEPELRHDLGAIPGKTLVLAALREAVQMPLK